MEIAGTTLGMPKDDSSSHSLPSLSRQTLAIMERIYAGIVRAPYSFVHTPSSGQIDTETIGSLMYELNFPRTLVERCDFTYGWDFKRLIRTLEDASFFVDKHRVPTQQERDNGMTVLRGLALVLSHLLSNGDYFQFRAQFAQTLANDGLLYEGGLLRRLEQDIIDKPKECSRLQHLIRTSGITQSALIEEHFNEAERLVKLGSFHASLSEWRSFYQSILQETWTATREARSEYKSYASRPTMSDMFRYLGQAGFLSADETLAHQSAYGFLSGGSHPGISEQEDAHLAERLCLALGQALLVKYQRWVERRCQSFE